MPQLIMGPGHHINSFMETRKHTMLATIVFAKHFGVLLTLSYHLREIFFVNFFDFGTLDLLPLSKSVFVYLGFLINNIRVIFILSLLYY